MKCERLKDTKSNDGRMDRVKPDEKDIIFQFILNFENFMDDSITKFSQKTEEEKNVYCLKRTEEEMMNENFYVLRNSQGKIVCIAHYKINADGTAKTGLVYTPDEERGRGYAAKLVHEITKIILDK
jgi:predicted GNAT family acetyltransferase